jgi:hypothetical protein
MKRRVLKANGKCDVKKHPGLLPIVTWANGHIVAFAGLPQEDGYVSTSFVTSAPSTMAPPSPIVTPCLL